MGLAMTRKPYMTRLRIPFLVLAVLILAGCPQVIAERLIFPHETDPLISVGSPAHYVAAPDWTSRGELLVFFPGTGGAPVHYREFVKAAAERGYHAVGLSYPNEVKVNGEYCGAFQDATCHERIRREILEGRDYSDRLEVSLENSIAFRLEALLLYLSGEYTEELWDTFLGPQGEPDWRRIAVAGHSQGAGHAGFISRNFAVRRAILFAGADWSFAENRLADWLNWPSATPASRIFFLSHLRDPAPRIHLVRAVWEAYETDVFGPEVLVEEDATGGFSNSHTLVTDLEPSMPGNLHGAPVVDAAIPRNLDGENLLDAAWGYMLTRERPFPGERISDISATNEVMVSPDLDETEGWLAYQDEERNLWVGKVDADTGLVRRDDSLQLIDSGLSPISESRKGPEFLRYAKGMRLLYVKRGPDGIPAIWEARYTESGWATQQISPLDGIARGGMIGVDSTAWSRPAIVYWYENGYTGELRWAWLDESPWDEKPLGPVLTGSTPARWGTQGRYLFFTKAVAGFAELHVLDTTTDNTCLLSDGESGIVNPVVWDKPSPDGRQLVGGVTNTSALEVFAFTPPDQVQKVDLLTAPDHDLPAYALLRSPEGFSWQGRYFVSLEGAREDAGGISDARIWVAEVLPDAERLVLRVDNLAETGNRADPEFFRTESEVFVYYQVQGSEGLRQVRTRTGLALFTNPSPLTFSDNQLIWDDSAEPLLQVSSNLSQWQSIRSRSPYLITPETTVFFRLVPDGHPLAVPSTR